MLRRASLALLIPCFAGFALAGVAHAQSHDHGAKGHDHGAKGHDHGAKGHDHGAKGHDHGAGTAGKGHDHGAAGAAKGNDHGATGGPLGHRFPDAKAWAKRFDDPKRDLWQKPAEVIRVMDLKPGMVVADIGAGTGYLEGRLAKAVGPDGKILGLDVEPDMVRYLGERATREKWTQVEARLVPYDDPQLAPASVDRIVILDTWHHIPDRPAYAKKLRAALRPGGKVIVVDFTLQSRRGPPRDHRIDAPAVIGELLTAGFDAIVAKESMPDQYAVVATVPPAVPPDAKAK